MSSVCVKSFAKLEFDTLPRCNTILVTGKALSLQYWTSTVLESARAVKPCLKILRRIPTLWMRDPLQRLLYVHLLENSTIRKVGITSGFTPSGFSGCRKVPLSGGPVSG